MQLFWHHSKVSGSGLNDKENQISPQMAQRHDEGLVTVVTSTENSDWQNN